MIEVEFTEVDEEIKDFSPTRLRRYWVRVSQLAEEGRRSAEALLQYGHKGLRVVVDSEWELAITCDDCNLWASMTTELPRMRLSYASVGGALLKVVDCSPTAVGDHFRDKVSDQSPWDGYSASAFDQKIISLREGQPLYLKNKFPKRHGILSRKNREALNEAATEE